MVNKKLVVYFGVLASATALFHQKVPWVPKAVAKAFGAGVLTYSLWHVQPSNGAMLEDAMILYKAVDQVAKNNNPTKVESPYPQPTPQEKKRLKEIDAEEEKKMNDLVRNKDLDDMKTEIKTEIDALEKKIDGVNSKIDFNSVVLGVGGFFSMLFSRWNSDIKRQELKVKQEELELKKKASESWWPRK
uniref:Uncharacterized protein n=1 Tax=Aureoumbra lagunensis TaxID=44058 RepID=A0A7S3JZB2_9STRA